MAAEYPVLLCAVTVTTGTNDTIVFNDGTADRTATIASGDYYLRGDAAGGDLVDAIETAFAAAPSSTLTAEACSLSLGTDPASPAGTFTFSAGQAFTLKNTGTFDLTLLGYAAALFPIASSGDAVASTLSPKVAWVGNQPAVSIDRRPARRGATTYAAPEAQQYAFTAGPAAGEAGRDLRVDWLDGRRAELDHNAADPFATYEGFWARASSGRALEFHRQSVSAGTTLAALSSSTAEAAGLTLAAAHAAEPAIERQTPARPLFSLSVSMNGAP